MMPDDPSESKTIKNKKPAPFSESYESEMVNNESKPLSEEEQKLVESMSRLVESIDVEDVIELDRSDLEEDDVFNSARGLRK